LSKCYAVGSDVSKEYVALFLSSLVEWSMTNGPLNSWKVQAVHVFDLSGTTHPAIQCHITEDQNPGLRSYENLRIWL
jgi:hypothetical protein